MARKITWVLIAVSISLSGCIAAAVNTSTYAVKGMSRGELLPEAEAGDAVAQYELGKSYCCMGPGFDTQVATEWFCKAARQDNADAMYELGRIYMGDVSRTPAPGQKLRRAISAKKSLAHAHLWLSRAAGVDHADAAALLSKLTQDINADERTTAANLAMDWKAAPCEYNAVFSL